MATLTSFSSSSSPSPNVLHFLTIKLDQHNYLLWKSQLLPILRGYDLIGYIDGTNPCPPNMISDPETPGKTKPNPAYISRQKHDELLLSWLIASLTESVHTKVIGMSTSKDVWTALEKHFSSQSRARLLQRMLQLQTIKKGVLSISDYLQKIKVITDNLAVAGHAVPDDEILLYILGGGLHPMRNIEKYFRCLY